MNADQLHRLETCALADRGRKEMRCQVAMADLYKAAFLLPQDVAIPNGNRNHSRFSGQSLIREWLEGSGYFTELPATDAQPGDLLVFRLGHSPHHVAILLGGGKLVHVFGEHGVQVAPCIPAQWAKRLDSAWRIVA